MCVMCFKILIFSFLLQVGNRKSLESSLRQLEREKALLQHKSLESHRKAESEADRKRCLENEGERRSMHLFKVFRQDWILLLLVRSLTPQLTKLLVLNLGEVRSHTYR